MILLKVDLLATFSSANYSKIPIENVRGLVRILCLEPRQNVPLHTHPRADEIFYVISGKAKINVGSEKADAESGFIIKAPAGIPHKWINGNERLTLLSILIPPESYELADEASKMEYV